VVAHETAGTRAIMPAFTVGFLRKKREATAIRFADDPEFTITAWREPNIFANASSKDRTWGPIVKWPLSITLWMASISR
jgi:hypothetical protein